MLMDFIARATGFTSTGPIRRDIPKQHLHFDYSGSHTLFWFESTQKAMKIVTRSITE